MRIIIIVLIALAYASLSFQSIILLVRLISAIPFIQENTFWRALYYAVPALGIFTIAALPVLFVTKPNIRLHKAFRVAILITSVAMLACSSILFHPINRFLLSAKDCIKCDYTLAGHALTERALTLQDLSRQFKGGCHEQNADGISRHTYFFQDDSLALRFILAGTFASIELTTSSHTNCNTTSIGPALLHTGKELKIGDSLDKVLELYGHPRSTTKSPDGSTALLYSTGFNAMKVVLDQDIVISILVSAGPTSQ